MTAETKPIITESTPIEETPKASEEALTENEPVKKKKSTIILGIVLGLVLIGGVAFAAFTILTGQRTISTGNASVRTDLIYITANMPGTLERFNVHSGMYVEAGQVLGWLQGGESFRSPVNGIVVSVSTAEGREIRPMESLATIADLNNLHIQANIYESDIQDVRLGQPVSVTLDGVRGQTFAGYVRYIRRITDLELAGGALMVQTGTFRRITHTVPIEITITDDVDLSLFLGTNARVSIPVID
jgi:multidrug resistance efflux pump